MFDLHLFAYNLEILFIQLIPQGTIALLKIYRYDTQQCGKVSRSFLIKSDDWPSQWLRICNLVD